MDDEIEMAWLGGLVDGEGSIAVARQTRKGYRTPIYYPKLVLIMTHGPTIQRAARILGCSYKRKRSRNPLRHKDVYGIHLSAGPAIEAIRKLHPFLFTKQRQAEVAIEFYRQCHRPRGTGPVPVEMAKLREKYFKQMAALNLKGPMAA